MLLVLLWFQWCVCWVSIKVKHPGLRRLLTVISLGMAAWFVFRWLSVTF